MCIRDSRSSIRVLSQKPLVILDACRTPQQAAALLRVLNMAKVLSLIHISLSMAGLARGSILTNHCLDTMGSMVEWQR